MKLVCQGIQRLCPHKQTDTHTQTYRQYENITLSHTRAVKIRLRLPVVWFFLQSTSPFSRVSHSSHKPCLYISASSHAVLAIDMINSTILIPPHTTAITYNDIILHIMYLLLINDSCWSQNDLKLLKIKRKLIHTRLINAAKLGRQR